MRLRTVVGSVGRGRGGSIVLACVCVCLGLISIYQEYRFRRLVENYNEQKGLLNDFWRIRMRVEELDLDFLNAEARAQREGIINSCAFTTQGQRRLHYRYAWLPGQMSTCYLISILHKIGKGNYQRYEDVSLLCVRLLGDLRDPVAEPMLEDVLQSSSGRLAEACRDSLKMLRERHGPP